MPLHLKFNTINKAELNMLQNPQIKFLLDKPMLPFLSAHCPVEFQLMKQKNI
jgi:hypothetical protein